MRIVLVDDHALFRIGVRQFLARSEDYEVVGEADAARACFNLVEATRPDVVLMDLILRGMDGVLATREILRRQPGARVIVLSAHDEIRDVIDAFDAGAAGYVLKADASETLLEALATVARGVRYVAPTLAPALAAAEKRQTTADVLDSLSEREREIFRLAADCHTSNEIARELCLARKTVDTHINRIHRKLGLRDRAELVRLAAGVGLVHSIRSPSR